VGIRLSDDELWAEMERAHTGIYTTLRRDGWPISLPTWFVAVDRQIYLSTPGRSKKVARIAHDRRGSFLVERGERWAELCAVMLPVIGEVLDPGEERDGALAALSRKYRDYRTRSSAMPRATRGVYSGPLVIRLRPAGPALTWDNARIRLHAGDRGS
jgi:hypothetical protein